MVAIAPIPTKHRGQRKAFRTLGLRFDHQMPQRHNEQQYGQSGSLKQLPIRHLRQHVLGEDLRLQRAIAEGSVAQRRSRSGAS
jgi:hypothetical protein